MRRWNVAGDIASHVHLKEIVPNTTLTTQRRHAGITVTVKIGNGAARRRGEHGETDILV